MTPDDNHMRSAIRAALRNPHQPFGAVLVDIRDNTIVAEGHNRSSANPTWHGEIDAINRFSERSVGDEWCHLNLYTTAEPCCMCQGAIVWAGISSVFYGTSISRLQQHGWRQIDIVAEEVVRRAAFSRCTLTGGILEAECDRLFVSAAESKQK